MRILLTLSIALLLGGRSGLHAQYNERGTVHLGLGIALGAYGTEYEQTITLFGIPFLTRSTGGAATITAPLEFHYGLADIFSLGVYAEGGRYIDSVETKRNTITAFGLQPRFYLVDRDRFSWMAGLQMGATTLRIDDPVSTGSPKSLLRGGHFGINTGVGFRFGETVGLQVMLRYLAHNLPLREYEFMGQQLDLDLVDAELRARGVMLQTSLHLRL
ncbi:MAG: hypothetical protein KIT10_02430 [Flavobacteriales bacterium]|nr:hypothetical protein [Flavobacteriales bacterium]